MMKQKNKWSKKGFFRRKSTLPFRIILLLTIMGGLALVAAAFIVPQGSGGVIDVNARGVEGGPDSYFKHIYDPNGLLGPLGQVDLDLDSLQRTTGNIILFAAFPNLPSSDPFFTLRTADQWAPGSRSDDRAIIVFLFMEERRIRAEVGYGFEEYLTDIKMGQIIQATMVPLLGEGEPTKALEACASELVNHLTQSPRNRLQRDITKKFSAHFREIKRKALMVATIWLRLALLPRLILSAVLLVLWCGIVSLVVNLAFAFSKLTIIIRQGWLRHNVEKKRHAPLNLLQSLTQILQAALIIFVIGAGGGYFLGGSGLFGGGGVNVFW